MSRIADQLKDYTNWAVGITVSVTLFLLARERLMELLQDDALLGIGAIALLIVTAWRFFQYLHAVRSELDLMDRVFPTSTLLGTQGPVLPTIIGLSIAFAVLLSSTTQLLIYVSVSVVFTFLDFLGPDLVNRNIARALLTDEFLESSNRPQARVLVEYYFGRPLTVRNVLMLAVMVLCFGLLVYPPTARFPWSAHIVYALLILNLSVGELIISAWRRERDKKLEDLGGLVS